LVGGEIFKWCVYSLIFISSLSLTIGFFDEEDTPYKRTLTALNDMCSLFFLAEMVLKMTAYGPTQYLKAKWHRLGNAFHISLFIDLSCANDESLTIENRFLRSDDGSIRFNHSTRFNSNITARDIIH
jgi:hypothetical protein